MNKLFLSYELSLLAKAKGYDGDCFAWYNPNGVFMWKFMGADEDDDYTVSVKDILEHKNDIYIPAPMHQQIIDWFRETKQISIEPYTAYRDEKPVGYCVSLKLPNNDYVSLEIGDDEAQVFETYYTALDEAIAEAFKLI